APPSDRKLDVASRRRQAPAGDHGLRTAARHAGGGLPPALLQVEPRAGARRGRLDSPGADEEVVGHPVLVAAELKGLLEPGQVAGLDVTWIAAHQATPKGEYVAIVPLLSRWVGGTELKHLPKLKVVANCAVGHDNVDVVAAELRGITVTNTPDVLTDATADLTWALILACARRVVEGVELVKSGQWAGWHPELLLGIELKGRTLGLFGAGRIGQAVGRRAVPFGMRVLYAARSPRLQFERESGAARRALAARRERDPRGAHRDGGDRRRQRAGGAPRRSAADTSVPVGPRSRPGEPGVARRGPECYWIGSPETTHLLARH